MGQPVIFQGLLKGKSSRQVVLAAASALLENSLTRAGWPQPVSLLVGFTKIDTEPKLALHAIWQADKSREELLEQERVTFFGKPADDEDGRLVSQRTIYPKLESKLLLY